MQQKTGQPVRFKQTEATREALRAWIAKARLSATDFLFPSRMTESPHISTRQYARLVHTWVATIGLESRAYGTHSLRRTKPTFAQSDYCLGTTSWKARYALGYRGR